MSSHGLALHRLALHWLSLHWVASRVALHRIASPRLALNDYHILLGGLGERFRAILIFLLVERVEAPVQIDSECEQNKEDDEVHDAEDVGEANDGHDHIDGIRDHAAHEMYEADVSLEVGAHARAAREGSQRRSDHNDPDQHLEYVQIFLSNAIGHFQDRCQYDRHNKLENQNYRVEDQRPDRALPQGAPAATSLHQAHLCSFKSTL